MANSRGVLAAIQPFRMPVRGNHYGIENG